MRFYSVELATAAKTLLAGFKPDYIEIWIEPIGENWGVFYREYGHEYCLVNYRELADALSQ